MRVRPGASPDPESVAFEDGSRFKEKGVEEYKYEENKIDGLGVRTVNLAKSEEMQKTKISSLWVKMLYLWW